MKVFKASSFLDFFALHRTPNIFVLIVPSVRMIGSSAQTCALINMTVMAAKDVVSKKTWTKRFVSAERYAPTLIIGESVVKFDT